MGRRESQHRKERNSSKLIKLIAHQNWNKREVLGRLLKEIDEEDLVWLDCVDKDSPYEREGRVVHKYGTRLEMREDMEHPDGIVIEVNGVNELIPYKAIKDYKILTFKLQKRMGVGY